MLKGHVTRLESLLCSKKFVVTGQVLVMLWSHHNMNTLKAMIVTCVSVSCAYAGLTGQIW